MKLYKVTLNVCHCEERSNHTNKNHELYSANEIASFLAKTNLCRATSVISPFDRNDKIVDYHCEGWTKIHPYNIFCSYGTSSKIPATKNDNMK